MSKNKIIQGRSVGVKKKASREIRLNLYTLSHPEYERKRKNLTLRYYIRQEWAP